MQTGIALLSRAAGASILLRLFFGVGCLTLLLTGGKAEASAVLDSGPTLDWTTACRQNGQSSFGGRCFSSPPESLQLAFAKVDANDKEGLSVSDPPTAPQGRRKVDTRKPYVELQSSYGYRRDRLDWNIAGNLQGEDPNILSELTWKDLLIHEMRFDVRTTLYRPFFFRGSIHYGVVVDGTNQDSDYAADDREMEFSRSNNNADDGSTLDGLLGVGYNLNVFSDAFHLIPQAGYSVHRQHLTMTDGYQTITWAGGPPLGPFDGLDSTYETRWWGPWIGFNLVLNVEKNALRLPAFSLRATYEYHWVEYEAQGDWNLREDFMHPKSFEHEADGNGSLVGVALCTRITDRWSVTLGYEVEAWTVEDGIDRVYLSDGTTIATRLNEVNWESTTLEFGLTLRF